MQPSSLIFLLVIAIWAAYLVQHWLRRREHLSTARTMDRFSQSMRILDRTRAGRASAPGAVSNTGSVPLHRRSARIAVAEVAGGATMAVPVPEHAASPASSPGSGRPRRLPAPPKLPVPAASRAGSAAAPAGASALAAEPQNGSAGHPQGARPLANQTPAADRVRTVVGGLFVASVGLTLAGTVLAATGALGWVVPALAALVGLASFLLLGRLAARSAVQRKARARRTASARPSSPLESARPAPAGHAQPGPARAGATPSSASGPGVVPVAARPRRAEVYDVAAVEPAVALAHPADALAAEPAPGAWSPVPVPPPTYTLKAKAVYPTPLDDSDEDDVASPYAAASPRDRRRVSG